LHFIAELTNEVKSMCIKKRKSKDHFLSAIF
jgi:hypothetical protein